jgi:hypothetical protein
MNWQDEHKRRIENFPRNVREAHEHSSNHRAEVTASIHCGCFYCCARFSAEDILDWVDEDENGKGQTALCPKCGIDSVIGDKSGFDISEQFLKKMKTYWF